MSAGDDTICLGGPVDARNELVVLQTGSGSALASSLLRPDQVQLTSVRVLDRVQLLPLLV